MPALGTGLTDSLSRLAQTQQRMGLPSSSSFTNSVTSTNKLDPGVQSRAAIAAPTDSTRNAQQVAFRDKLNQYSDWSKGQTAVVRAGALAKQAQAAARQQSQQVRPVSNQVGGGQSQGSNAYADYNPATNSSSRAKIVKTALSYVGTPYAWGGGSATVRTSRGTGMGTQNVIGVDCSGLTSFAYNAIGVRLPRHSNSQTAYGVRTNIRNAQPGDIVGWGRGGHVAIYIGNGQIVESPKPGMTVRVRKLGANENVYAVRLRLPGE